MDEDSFSALVFGHLLDAVRLAIVALNLVDVPREITLAQLQQLDAARQGLEASTVTLLIQTGVTWEAMARQLGVTRQSLHRRLSVKSAALQGKPHKMDRLEDEWKLLRVVLEQDFEEVSRLNPRQIARQSARNVLRKE